MVGGGDGGKVRDSAAQPELARCGTLVMLSQAPWPATRAWAHGRDVGFFTPWVEWWSHDGGGGCMCSPPDL